MVSAFAEQLSLSFTIIRAYLPPNFPLDLAVSFLLKLTSQAANEWKRDKQSKPYKVVWETE